MHRLALSFICCALLAALPLHAKNYNVLMLGNSYTAQTWTQIRDFFAADPDNSITFTRITPGGQQLHQHNSTTSTTDLITTGGPWDIVVLQDQSQTPAFAAISASWWNTFYTAGAKPLTERAQAAGATVVFFQTWARAAADTATLQYFNNDPLIMQDALTSSYGTAASLHNATVAPVGEAWEDAIAANPGLALHSGDNSHPATAGAFLTGAVFYETITGRDARTNSHTGGLSANNASFLRSIAHYVFYNDWAATHSTLTNSSPTADPDNDGVNNEDEWLAGTSPTASDDRFQAQLHPQGGTLEVRYPSSTEREYIVETRPNPDTPWQTSPAVQGSGGLQTRTVSPNPAGTWIRVRSRRPAL